MNLSLGGDSALYLSIPAFFKAAYEENIRFEEIHCTGFSCIPAFYITYFNSVDRAYLISRNIFDELKNIFNFYEGVNLLGIVRQFRMLYKASRSMHGVKNQKLLKDFITKNFPDITTEKVPALKIHVFNLETATEEIVTGRFHEALMKTLSFPLDYSPYENCITGSWAYGVPNGDLIVLLEKNTEIAPKNALDYMTAATIARTKKIIELRSKKAKHVLKATFTSIDPIIVAPKLYKETKKFFQEHFKNKE
ncbi:hypothetical protein JYK00_06590 [Thermosipho ferrireducens]|uniref:Uncharacterized protein n=1 Tax=Thermosipho ferrireducens TaxID=2571116 RepID=A0ABX7S4L3_9BACT|nr:hypothetical protein [Thermosipho ferrireducens]QTA37402.1 hypothetical protein JYK00_06590 [Thermosipho ferrireducens]